LWTESAIVSGNESVDRNLSALAPEDQLESIGKGRAQHESRLISERTGRRVALRFGSDIKPFGIDPIRASDDLIIVHTVRGLHKHPKRHVGRSVATARLNNARGPLITSAARFDRYNFEGRSLVRLSRERAHRHCQ
jgi:hypothetical protein